METGASYVGDGIKVLFKPTSMWNFVMEVLVN